jgi:hypothetical protein
VGLQKTLSSQVQGDQPTTALDGLLPLGYYCRSYVGRGHRPHLGTFKVGIPDDSLAQLLTPNVTCGSVACTPCAAALEAANGSEEGHTPRWLMLGLARIVSQAVAGVRVCQNTHHRHITERDGGCTTARPRAPPPSPSPAMFAPINTLQSMLRYFDTIWLIS